MWKWKRAPGCCVVTSNTPQRQSDRRLRGGQQGRADTTANCQGEESSLASSFSLLLHKDKQSGKWATTSRFLTVPVMVVLVVAVVVQVELRSAWEAEKESEVVAGKVFAKRHVALLLVLSYISVWTHTHTHTHTQSQQWHDVIVCVPDSSPVQAQQAPAMMSAYKWTSLYEQQHLK